GLDGGDVAARVFREVGQGADVVDRLGPAIEFVIDRGRPRECRAARWPRLYPPAVELVGDAQADRVDPRQDVELVEHDAADAVDGDGIAQRHGVEPADAPRSPRHGPALMAALRTARTA